MNCHVHLDPYTWGGPGEVCEYYDITGTHALCSERPETLVRVVLGTPVPILSAGPYCDGHAAVEANFLASYFDGRVVVASSS